MLWLSMKKRSKNEFRWIFPKVFKLQVRNFRILRINFYFKSQNDKINEGLTPGIDWIAIKEF